MAFCFHRVCLTKKLFDIISKIIKKVHMNIVTKGATISINGVQYSGTNISINDNNVVVDGVIQKEQCLVGPISVQVLGDCHSIECTWGDVNVTGAVLNSVSTVSGDVRCANVGGSVNTASGDISCRYIGGSVNTVSGTIMRR